MLLKSYLAAVVLTFGLASGAHAAAVTINGPHASLDCTTCHANGQFKAPAKETCFQCHQSYQTVAERTAKMNPNPHSNHRGERIAMPATACTASPISNATTATTLRSA